MRDFLVDIVKNTYALGTIDTVKIIGSETETAMEAVAKDRTFIIKGKFKNPIPFYFSHSYHMIPNQKSNVIGEANHLDTKINAVIKEENVLAIQFHPERSGYTGLDFLDWAINFENWL